MANSSTETVWLRGGGIYFFKYSRNVSATAQSTTYTIYGQSVTPTSSAQNTVWNSSTGSHQSYYDAAYVAATTASSSAVTGALQVAGGIGVGAASYFGGGVNIAKGNGGNLNGPTNAAIYLSVDESTIQGPGTNTNIRMGGNLIASANSYLFLATNGTTALTITNTQAATFAGTVTASGFVGNLTGNATTVTNGVYVGATNTFTLQNYFRSNQGAGSYVGASNSYGIQAYSTDGGAAAMSFHRSGYYAVNMGLDPDNVLRIGGWSASANRWQLDMSGNNTIAGNFVASGTGTSTFAGAVTAGTGTSGYVPVQLSLVNSGSATTGAIRFSSQPDGAGGYITFNGTVTANSSGTVVSGSSTITSDHSSRKTGLFQFVGGTTGSAGFQFFTSDGGTTQTLTERLRIQHDGKVGIGTTAPGQKFEVAGASGVIGLSVYDTGDANGDTTQINLGASASLPQGAVFLKSIRTSTFGANTDFAISTTLSGSQTERMRVDSGGNVGIGTASPTHKLHLASGFIATSFGFNYTPSAWARGYGGVIMAGSANSDGTGWSYGGRIVEVDEGDGLNMAFDVNYTNSWTNNAMVISGRSGKQGNVGIGTTSPSAKLHIVGEIIRQENSSTTFWGTDATGTYIRTFGGDTLRVLRASGVETVRFISNGNVGIGTTGPTSRIAVNAATNSYANSNGSYTGGGLGHSGWGGSPTFNGYSGYPGAGMGQNIDYGDNPGGAAGGTFFGGPGSYTTGGGAALYALGGDGGYYASAGVGIYAKGGAHGGWAVAGQEGNRARASAGYFDGDLTVVNGNIIIGGVATTGLTGSNGLKVTSTTASSSTTTGAVVVAGGIGVVAASYFGSTVATGALTVTGAITATGNITAYFSDDRLKTRLGPITNALEKIKSLTGFYFEPNKTAQGLGYEKKTDVGVSAQEVQAILPEIIAPAPIDSKYMTVRYEKLIPLLIEAIKAQQRQIEELQLLVQTT
jgi:hypothetical protein